LITSKIEHHAVINPCKRLEKEGFKVTYLAVDGFGRVDPEELRKAIRPETILITIMSANNEIGTIQDIREFGRIARGHNVLFHTDAVQAIGAYDIDVVRDNIDMLSLSAHKFYGPKGVGALYIKSGVKIGKLIMGGEQERGLRGGTTNVPAVVGLGKAIEIAVRDRDKNSEHSRGLRDRLIAGIKKEIPSVRLNGHPSERLPNNVNFSFEFIEGEGILMRLDLQGIATSSGSACSSGSLEPSHVLLACGLDHATAHGSIRFTFGKRNTAAEVDTVIVKLKKIVENLRMMSPLFKVEEGGKKSV
jgi:cysteine desulfurase